MSYCFSFPNFTASNHRALVPALAALGAKEENGKVALTLHPVHGSATYNEESRELEITIDEHGFVPISAIKSRIQSTLESQCGYKSA